MIILQDSIQLQQNQEIKISDTISYLNTNAEQPFSDRPLFRPEILPGKDFKDRVTGVPAVCSIAGTRYGIMNGVITQFAANQPPIEDDGVRGCPAFTQLSQKTEDLTDSAWIKTNLSVPLLSAQVYGQNIFLMPETTTNGTHSLSKSAWFSGAAVDNSVIGISCIVKYSGRKIAITFTKRDSTSARVRTLNGVMENTDGGISASLKDIGNGYYSFFAAMNVGVGGAAPQAYLQLLNDANNTSYVGDIDKGLYVGHISFINFGVNGIPFIPPYVPNNTSGSISVVSEAATATTGTSFDLDDPKLARLKSILRGPNAEGHVELTLTSAINSSWLPTVAATDYSICVVKDDQFNFLNTRKYTDGRFQFNLVDSAFNGAILISSMTPGQEIRIVADFGNINGVQKQRITVNGVKSAIAAFSGTYGTGDLKLFYGNTIHIGHIVKDSLKISDRPQW